MYFCLLHSGENAVHSITVRFYALWTTTYSVIFSGENIENGTIAATGWTERQISLPVGLVAPSQHDLTLSYKDKCESRSYTVVVFIEEKVDGITLRVSRNHLIYLI